LYHKLRQAFWLIDKSKPLSMASTVIHLLIGCIDFEWQETKVMQVPMAIINGLILCIL
jgi:hypothetical protein